MTDNIVRGSFAKHSEQFPEVETIDMSPTRDGYKHMKLMFMQERDFVSEKIVRIEDWQDSGFDSVKTIQDLVEDAFNALREELYKKRGVFTKSIDEITTYLEESEDE